MQMLSYVSEARIPANDRALAARHLMHVAQKRNAELDISGVLFLRGDTFLQTIEGPDYAVQSLFRSIASDRKHKSVCVLVNEQIEQRRFSGWSMECYHESNYLPDYIGTLQQIEKRFESEARFTALNVYSYFEELLIALDPYRLTKAA